MDAYQMGLTGEATEWAMRKQRSHHQAGKQAMMLVDAMLN